MLARGELHCVGATTLDEYRKHVEKDAALERRFQPVLVDAPTVEDTISILRGLKERFEVHHGVRIQDNALVAAAQLSNRYISDRFLPDKAIDLVDEASRPDPHRDRLHAAGARRGIETGSSARNRRSRIKKGEGQGFEGAPEGTAGRARQQQRRNAFIEGKMGSRAPRHRRRARVARRVGGELASRSRRRSAPTT
jgi:ATP-dependent Clp protease ATP-binding subunit ClpA